MQPMQRALCPVLIGREKELSELEDALLAANRGEGQVVVLAGDAGMGKTRLATELQRRARRLSMSVLWGGCSEAELALPYLPFLEAIGNFLAGADIEDLRTRLGPVRRELAHLFPQLEPEGVAPDVDSTQGRLRLYEAVLALLMLAAREQGLLLLIEDLHWADASTRELLDYLTRRLRNARIMVLATYRSDEMHRKHPLLPLVQGWKRGSSASVVQLEPLSSAKLAEMVVAIFDLGDEGVADDTREFLHQRTEGNPFVLEEMLKASLDRGDIFRNEEGWTRKSLDEFRLPDSVRETILLRLDRLTPLEVEVLRAAAVLGAGISFESLLAISGRSQAEVRSAVETCVMQQLLVDDPRHPRVGYGFRHALTREAIYDDIITPVKEGLHGLAADHLRAVGGGPLEVSRHLLLAGRSVEAVPLCLAAAERAESEYAHADAAALYERVLPYLVEHEEVRADVLCRLGTAYWGAGHSSAAHGFLKNGISLLEQLDDLPHVAHFRLVLGRCAWEMGRSDEALQAYEQARHELEPFGPSRDLALACVRLAGCQAQDLNATGAIEWSRKAIEIAELVGSEEARVQALNYLAGGLLESGSVEDGLATFDHGFREAMRLDLYSVAVVMLNNLTVGRCELFLASSALDSLNLLDAIPDSPTKSIVGSHVEGMAAYAVGDLARAARAWERESTVAREVGQTRAEVRGRKGRADCLFGMGRDDEALAIRPALDELSGVDDRIWVTRDRLRHSLARDDLVGVEDLAELVFEVSPSLAAANRSSLAAWCMWAFLATGNVESASRASQIGIGDGINVPPATRGLLDAGIASLAGDIAGAAGHLRESLRLLDAADYHLDACPVRRRLASLLLEQDDVEGAVAELQIVLKVASRLGMVVEARLAAEELRRLGTAVPEDAVAPAAAAGATGERYVTVLFMDVRGYTALTREEPPAEVADAVATLQRWAAREVSQHHGLVDKFAGDAVMATFNVSGAHVDHAQHALACALAIRDKAGALGLPMGAGIATGPAVVGALKEGANVSVIGEATNLASRLQGQAGPGEILLSMESHRRVVDWLTSHGYVAEGGPLELKGFAQPVDAWRLGAGRSAGASATRGETT